MKHKEHFSKLFFTGLILVASFGVIIFLRERFGLGILGQSSQNDTADLVIINDSRENMSVEYREGGKGISPVVQPGAKISGGQGFIRIFTAQKPGSYEVEYEYPRPAGAKQEVKLSQIVGAAKQDSVDREIFLKQGMIGDIKVEYEQALDDLDVTY